MHKDKFDQHFSLKMNRIFLFMDVPVGEQIEAKYIKNLVYLSITVLSTEIFVPTNVQVGMQGVG